MTDIAIAGTFRLADVFSKAVAIYGRRFAPFVVLTMIASLPNYLALFAIGIPTGQPGTASFGAARVGLGLVDFATRSLVSGAVIYGVVQDLRGRTFSVADSIRIALRRFLPMLGVAVCTTLAIGLGAILLFVPGIILACMYYVSTPVCVAEQAGVFASMSRSSFLTKGYRWQVFGTLLLIMIGGLVLGLITAVIFTATGRIGLLISSQVLSAIVSSINGVIIGVFYYELRVAKEGIDIDKIASVFD